MNLGIYLYLFSIWLSECNSKPPNMIILGQTQSYNINLILTITNGYYLIAISKLDLWKLITLSKFYFCFCCSCCCCCCWWWCGRHDGMSTTPFNNFHKKNLHFSSSSQFCFAQLNYERHDCTADIWNKKDCFDFNHRFLIQKLLLKRFCDDYFF